jgi:hypothetical protein
MKKIEECFCVFREEAENISREEDLSNCVEKWN